MQDDGGRICEILGNGELKSWSPGVSVALIAGNGTPNSRYGTYKWDRDRLNVGDPHDSFWQWELTCRLVLSPCDLSFGDDGNNNKR